MKLNIGCGRNPIEGYVNLDRATLPGVDAVFDLEQCGMYTGEHPEGFPLYNSLPFKDDYFEELQAIHTLEHITRILPVMQELWRVSKQGAIFTIHVPFGGCDIAWEDPTHVRRFFPQSFMYFSQAAYKRADYDYRGDWIVESIAAVVPKDLAQNFESPDDCGRAMMHWRNVALELRAKLRCCKPQRDPLTAEDPQVVLGLAVADFPALPGTR